MPDWNSRLAVKFEDDDGTHTISPLESFQPTFAMNAEPINSVEAVNVGVIYNPEQISFTITAKAIGTSVARLTKLALDGTRFQIVMEEVDEGDDEWSLSEILLSRRP